MVLLKQAYLLISISLLPGLSLPAQSLSGIVNDYRKVISIDTAKGILRLSNASNCTQYIGHSLMIIQMKGATIDASNTSGFGNITALNNAGRFEIGQMCGQLSDSIILENKMQNFYDVTGLVQVVFMPKYTNLIITGTLEASLWDPVAGTGGVIALETPGTLTLNASISADSAGFRGGALLNQSSMCSNFFVATDYWYPSTGTFYSGAKKGEGIAEYISGEEYGKGKQSNGGGGGNNANNGGGGGSNYSVGGTGGHKSTGCMQSNPGIGGTPLSTFGYSAANFKIFLGGGGGAGHENDNVGTPGGHGGGIVFIKANSLVNAGSKITANGSVGYNPANIIYPPYDPYSSLSDGGGGGGAGGTVILQVTNFVNPITIEAKGARGCNTEVGGTSLCAGPGGGGSGGYVWLSPASIPANVTIDVAGGTNGLILAAPCLNQSNGATAGSTGSFSGGFAFPALKDSSPICKQILPFNLIASFSGILQNEQVKLTLELTNSFEAGKCIVQYSSDGLNFIDILEQLNNNSMVYYFNYHHNSPSYYRSKVITVTGGIEYSQTIYFKPELLRDRISVFPNPIINNISIHSNLSRAEFSVIKIYDEAARIVYSTQLMLQAGENTYQLPLCSLNKGVYTLQITTQSRYVSMLFFHL